MYEQKETLENLVFSRVLRNLVEMGGIEPPSESALQGASPGAGGYLHSLTRAQAAVLPGSVAS